MTVSSKSSVPRLVLRDGGFEIWEVEGEFHLIVPSMGTVVCETELEAVNLLLETQGHVHVRGQIQRKGGATGALNKSNGSGTTQGKIQSEIKVVKEEFNVRY